MNVKASYFGITSQNCQVLRNLKRCHYLSEHEYFDSSHRLTAKIFVAKDIGSFLKGSSIIDIKFDANLDHLLTVCQFMMKY